jgi:hypothetical protein
MSFTGQVDGTGLMFRSRRDLGLEPKLRWVPMSLRTLSTPSSVS